MKFTKTGMKELLEGSLYYWGEKVERQPYIFKMLLTLHFRS